MPSSGAGEAPHHRFIETRAPRNADSCEVEMSVPVFLREAACLVPAESPETCLWSQGLLAHERYILVAPLL